MFHTSISPSCSLTNSRHFYTIFKFTLVPMPIKWEYGKTLVLARNLKYFLNALYICQQNLFQWWNAKTCLIFDTVMNRWNATLNLYERVNCWITRISFRVILILAQICISSYICIYRLSTRLDICWHCILTVWPLWRLLYQLAGVLYTYMHVVHGKVFVTIYCRFLFSFNF